MSKSAKKNDQELFAACNKSNIWFSELQALDAKSATFSRGISPASEVHEIESNAVVGRWNESLKDVYSIPAKSNLGAAVKQKVLISALKYNLAGLQDAPENDVVNQLAWSMVLDLSFETAD